MLALHARGDALTQGLADAVGVSCKTINTVERGVFVPSTILALNLVEVLDVAVEDLFWLSDDEH